jgi:hypothetical protein
MIATFRCLASGNLVTFTAQVDIDGMKGHDGYVQQDTNQEANQEDEASSSSKEVLSKKSTAKKTANTSTEE